MPTKEELIQEFTQAKERVAALVRDTAAADWQKGVYEGGWNARQILAHIGATDYGVAVEGVLARAKGLPAPSGGRPADVDFNTWNQRIVDERAGRSVPELAAAFAAACDSGIAKLQQTVPEELSIPIPSGFGAGGPAGDLIRRVGSGHVLGHIGDIEQGLKAG